MKIVADLENNLSRFGDSYEGVGWTRKHAHVDLRFRVLLAGLRAEWKRPLTLLDFGCGASHLYEYMLASGIEGITYAGMDLSSRYLDLCRQKFPGIRYIQSDILANDEPLPVFDFTVMNGVFHYKGANSHEQTWSYVRKLLTRVHGFSRLGFAFNVMSDLVDWERDDLFHLPVATAVEFIGGQLSRNFSIRHDYGLYEYTVHVYKDGLSDFY